MSKTLSRFSPVAFGDSIYSAARDTLRCVALRLKSGGLCLYNPVAGLGEAARDSLREIGATTILLAPNHYHNKAAADYAHAYATAQLVCSDLARPRLEKITGLEFTGLAQLEADLPKEMEILEPPGLKTGEVWIRVRSETELVWIVSDAFCGADSSTPTEVPALLGTFPKYGVGDKDRYRAWVDDQIASQPPTCIIPCHGSVIRSKTLPADLRTLLDENL